MNNLTKVWGYSAIVAFFTLLVIRTYNDDGFFMALFVYASVCLGNYVFLPILRSSITVKLSYWHTLEARSAYYRMFYYAVSPIVFTQIFVFVTLGNLIRAINVKHRSI